MFSIKLLVALMLVVTVVAVIAALIYNSLSRSSQVAVSRVAMIRGETKRVVQRDNDVASRRKQISESLKELEKKNKNNVTLELKLEQAGLSLTKKGFIIASCAGGVLMGLASFILLGPLYGLGGVMLGGLGIPNWVIASLRAKRVKAFINHFPGAIDVIIRGVKSGLPLGACLQTVATQSQEPVRSEFERIVASTTVGLTIAEAIERMAQRVPLPETSFFAIVVNIQQKAGGNLTEALGNLTQVLRDRMTMDLKVKALSSEAKSSAWIIGSLPIVLSGVIHLAQPGYLAPLWHTDSGKMVLSCIAIWMGIGIAAMRTMINFKP